MRKQANVQILYERAEDSTKIQPFVSDHNL